MFSHSAVYFITSLRQVLLYSSTEIFVPMSSLWIPSFFSADLHRESVGVPSGAAVHLVAGLGLEPADRILDGTRHDMMDPGLPLAEGGPSKNMNSGAPSLTSRDFSNA